MADVNMVWNDYSLNIHHKEYTVKKEEIIKKLEDTEEQISKFRKRLKTSDLCEDLYDNAILQKAILLKQLEDCDKNSFVENVKNGIKKLVPNRKKTLICDYFKG